MEMNEEQDSDEGMELSLPDASASSYADNVPVCELEGQIPILEADVVFLLMRRDIPVSRTTRVKWLLDRMNTTIALPNEENYDVWEDKEQEFKILSIIPMDSSLYHEAMYFHPENSHYFKYLITSNTKVKFIAQSYRIVYCLDMSPSQSTVDIQQGEILFDEVLACFKKSLKGMSMQFSVPGCTCVMQPSIYLTVIAHTPFFMTPAQQVLLKGIQVSSLNIDEIFSAVEKQLKRLEERIADVAGMAHDQIEEQTVENEKIVGGLFEEDQSDPIPNIPMVSPDANFVNMLRYSMLALSLLPENSLSNIIVVTDGVVALPDVNIMESLLMQLHYDSTAVSFIKVGSSFHPHVSAGYVPYNDVLNFLSHSTMGTCLCLSSEVVTPQRSLQMNLYHKAYLTWTFHNKIDDINMTITSPNEWNTINEYFHGDKAPCLLRKKQTEDKINTSLLHILSRRLREGYTIDKIKLENDILHIDLSLPWKNFIYLQYSMTTQWPQQQSVVHFDVHIAAPYEFLHDITCLMKKELKSSYRQAVVERFWYVLTTLGQGDIALAQHLNSFQSSSNWYTVPESVKSGMPVFVMMNSVPMDNFKPQFTAGDTACPKFGTAWQPICQLENSQWSKWFHTHKISLIIHHDDPRPRNLHLANSSGRFQIVQCRQAATVLYGKLTDWASFVLIENHSYVKFLYCYIDKPIYFCILRVTSKLPCAVINIGFNNGTPGYIRQKVVTELRAELAQLSYVSSPLKCKENSCCTILQKPLEKILIRYERMPSDFSTVVFPDGTQPPNPHQAHNPPLLVIGALFTTLSRYLYHKRWVWNATHPNNPKLGVNAIARILSTITKMRLKEGFTFAHSSSGIINMVLEVEMGPICSDYSTSSNSLSCVIQYVLFPPHCSNRGEMREQQNSGSEDETDVEQEVEMELQMVTEVWIEPQYGQVVRSPLCRLYMESEPYYKLADKIGYVDFKCISSLLTLEHLSLMCQTKASRFEDMKMNETFLETTARSSENGTHIPKRRKISNARKRTLNHCGPNTSTLKETGYFGKDLVSPKTADLFFQSESAPSMEERIHHIPFHFNLNNILPLSQQTELLFSMFIEDKDAKLSSDQEKSNKILMEIFHDHILLLNDRELNLGPEDSYHFLDLLRQRHNKVPMHHRCPVSAYSRYKSEDPSIYQPQWRCFIKGVSTTHVILTFVPATLKDLKALNNVPSFKLFNRMSRANSDTDLSTDDDEEPIVPKEGPEAFNGSLTLPVYVYDCPIAVLMNSYVNPLKNIKTNIKDVYEDCTFSMNQNSYDFDNIKQKVEVHDQNPRSPEPKSEESENQEIKTCIRQQSRALILVHVKCFVVALFKALHCRSHISSQDIQYAVDQCEEATKDINITEFLKVICSHIKSHLSEKIVLETLRNSKACGELHPLHNLIKQKFMKIIMQTFQPVPTHPDFYYCHPCILPAIKSTTKDEDSDDEMSIPSEIVEFKSESSSNFSGSMPALGDISMHTETDVTEDITAESEEIRPLFLHLTCTVYCRNMVFPSVPIKSLPTCLADLIVNLESCDNFNLKDIKVTLDIICLTLPTEVQAITREFAPKGIRNTSFCSVSSFQSNSSSSENSLISDDQHCNENMFSLNHLPELQHRAVSTLKEEIEWLLKDEMATSLLDVEPVSMDTLNMVIQHVETSIDKVSCKKDVINLNFVYGTTQSHTKFLQEFKKMPLNMYDGSHYKLCESGDLYYVAKKNECFETMTEADKLKMLTEENDILRLMEGKEILRSTDAKQVLQLTLGKDISRSEVKDSLRLTELKEVSSSTRINQDLQLTETKNTLQLLQEEDNLQSEVKDIFRLSETEQILHKDLSVLKEKKNFSQSSEEKDFSQSSEMKDTSQSSETKDTSQSSEAKDTSSEAKNTSRSSEAKDISQLSEDSIISHADSDYNLRKNTPHNMQNNSAYNLRNDSTHNDSGHTVNDSSYHLRNDSVNNFQNDYVNHFRNDSAYNFRNDSAYNLRNDVICNRIDAVYNRSDMMCIRNDSNEHLCYQQSDISSVIGSVFGTEDYHDDSDEENYDWLLQLDKKRNILPNFWLILRIEQDAVTIYFHCRFLELPTSKVNSYLRIQRKVIYLIKDLCKRVNQSLLLQYLHDTRMCDRLLEPEDEKKDIWHSDNTTPTITRNTSYARLKSIEDTSSDGMEFQQVAYLEASLKFMPGFFRCNVVWETPFSLHPRLKTGPGKSGLSRGIQALRTVLNKFSVSNRSNMFVYQDNNSNVFYLRLHENVQTCGKVLKSRSELDATNGIVSRSPSIVSLPLGQQRSLMNYSDNSTSSIADIRPRVRSFGEKERTEPPIEDTIILKVHGITDADLDVKRDLVQVLQNRLDDAVLEVLSMMLARNAMCPLTPEDVQFLQKPFKAPEHIIKLSIPKHTYDYLNPFIQFLRQNLLQFLNIPKYTDSSSHNHFKDYSEPDLNTKIVLEDRIFLYNQGQNPSSGSKGIACVALAVGGNKVNENNLVVTDDDQYLNIFNKMTFEEAVHTELLPNDMDELPGIYIEFRIWKQGRVNFDSLNFKLQSAISQAVWDLISEYYLLRAPLCYVESEDDETSSLEESSSSSRTLQDIPILRLSYKKRICRRTVPIGSKAVRKITFDNTSSEPSVSSASVSPLTKLQDFVQSVDMKLIESKTKVTLNRFEKGETGRVHRVYSYMFLKWFEYAVHLNVPSVKKINVHLKNRHTVGICVRELQCIMSNLAPDTVLKAFIHHPVLTDEIVYIPYNYERSVSKCLLIGRNFEQWKICKTNGHYGNHSTETDITKLYQKFSSLTFSSDSKYVSRQRLFFAIIQSHELMIYMYNWSKERVDKLIVQTNNLGLWLSARTSVLNSIVAQKRGIFQNQMISRKLILCNNPYLTHINESSEHLNKFPLNTSLINKEWVNPRKLSTPVQPTQGVTIDAYRDSLPLPCLHGNESDPVVSYIQEMQELRNRNKLQLDEKKKMHGIWQSRGATGHLLQSNLLRKHSRVIHYCHTPLLFLPRWRFQSAATRDHSLSPEMLNENHTDSFSRSESHEVGIGYDETWHHELCSYFIKEYKQYLQTLGFVPLELDANKRSSKSKNLSDWNNEALCYVQKPMLGGIMVFAIQLKEPFFTVKLHAVECSRVQQKVSRNSVNQVKYQFTISFLDECDRIKSLMHLHSFTYDFHLRTIHTYVAGGSNPRVCTDYHLTKFLDDFTKYYPKTPNFARNVVCAETISIGDLITEGNQLYIYLLSNYKQYKMQVLSMRREDTQENENEYVLVQVTSTPQVWYKDSQDRQQTDDFDVTLVISNLSKTWQPNENILHLKFYIILTSRREIYPKCDVEKTLGKFRTVSSGGRFAQCNDSCSELNKNIIMEPEKDIGEENKVPETIEKPPEDDKPVFMYDNNEEKVSSKSEEVTDEVTDEDIEEKKSTEDEIKTTKVGSSRSRSSRTHVEIKQESVNYIGYYSSHEQLMQQLILDRAAAARKQIRLMVDQGMVHCRTHLLWNKLVSHQESNQLTYNEFIELRNLAKLENLTDFHPDLKMLLDQPFSWYQGLLKVLLAKYQEQHRIYVSSDGNIQHLVVLHPRYSGTFMLMSMDLHTNRGELYAVSRELPQGNTSELCSTDREELIKGFICCIGAHIWAGMVTISL